MRRLSRTGAFASLLALACADGGSSDSAPVSPGAPSEPRPLEALPPAVADNPTPEAPSVPEPVAPPASDPTPPGAGVETPAPPRATCNDSVSFDDLYAAIDDDLQDAGSDAPFVRYISTAHRLNQGLCPEDLESDRLALVKALNSLSTKVRIVLPEPVDDAGVLFRIDLRDLGWDQPAQLGGVEFADKWEAIIATSPLAVELEGGDADSAKEAALTAVPLMLLDALVDATVVGDLYYELVGIGENAFDLFGQLAIDFADTPVRAGTSSSRMSPQDTIIQRFERGDVPGFYWSRFDIADTTAGQSIFANPLEFGGDVISSLFTLPNGFIAYALFDGAGARIPETGILVDRSQRDGQVRNSVSCSGCHAAGVNAVTDEVRAYVEANRFDFDNATFGDVRDQFLPQAELDAVIKRDAELYQASLARAGLTSSGVDPVNAVYSRFDSPVTLEVAAGELGVTPSDLARQLTLLSAEASPVLASLRTQTLRREQFEAVYAAALCRLLVSSENQPVAAACEAQQ